MAETSLRGMPTDHIKLLNDFVNVKEAREYSKFMKINKFVLSYTEADGYSIELDEIPTSQLPQAEA